MSTRRDYYEVLGIAPGASTDDVRKAYRQLARQCHPDVNKSPDAEERFKEINEAYEVLSDQEKRAAFDRFGHAGLDSTFGGFSGFSDPFDIFESFFGGFGRTRTRKGPRAGEDLRANLTLSFEEAVFGTEKELELERLDRCPSCKGTGAAPGSKPISCPECGGTGEVRRVRSSVFGSFVNVSTCPRCRGEGSVISDPCPQCQGRQRTQATRRIAVQIPPGVDDGTRIRLAGEGNAGINDGPSGHLYAFLSVKPHAYFQRQDNDIYLNLNINFAQAALGAEITVPTLNGDIGLVIPPATQTGHTFRIKGQGVPYLRRKGRGDQRVTVFVATPSSLTAEQKHLLRELSKTLDKETIAQHDRGWFDKIRDAFRL